MQDFWKGVSTKVHSLKGSTGSETRHCSVWKAHFAKCEACTLEYLDLEDGRPCTLFDKSGGTSTLYLPIYYPLYAHPKCLP